MYFKLLFWSYLLSFSLFSKCIQENPLRNVLVLFSVDSLVRYITSPNICPISTQSMGLTSLGFVLLVCFQQLPLNGGSTRLLGCNTQKIFCLALLFAAFCTEFPVRLNFWRCYHWEDSVTGLVVWKTLRAKVLFQNCFKAYTVLPNIIDYKGSIQYFGDASSK